MEIILFLIFLALIAIIIILVSGLSMITDMYLSVINEIHKTRRNK